MLGYSEKKIAQKAAKRKITVDEYKKYLIKKRLTRPERHRAAVEARKAEGGAK
jgi:hypothetical protein